MLIMHTGRINKSVFKTLNFILLEISFIRSDCEW
jgi:hypothetical protein